MGKLARRLIVVSFGLSALAGAACKDDAPGNPPVAPAKPGTGGAAGQGGQGGRASGGSPGTGSGGAAASADAASGASDVGGETGAAPDATADAGGDAAKSIAADIGCSGVKDKATAITPAAGRKVYCAIDLGSNNLKLQVLSMEPGKPLSFKDERQCRVRTGFGAIVAPAGMPKAALPPAAIADLTAVIKEFQRICTLDTGTLVGTEATQWARDATNMTDVLAMVKAATGVDIEVLTPIQEGVYGYAAATRNAPEKFSLDPGSNSFQIAWLPKGTTEVKTVSVPFGYVRAGAKHYPEATTDTYDVARAKHAAELEMLIDAELGKLTPPTSLAMLKAAITAGTLRPELFIPGQDGALHLAFKASLRDPMGKWIGEKAAYDERVGMEKPVADPMFGDITTKLEPADIAGFFTTVIKPADFAALKAAPVRALYGEKVLGNAVLLDTLVKKLGLTTIVLVPQELPAGYVLAKAAKL